MCSKSANYCFATPIRNEGLLLLSEVIKSIHSSIHLSIHQGVYPFIYLSVHQVSLGKPNELLAADYNAHRLPKGTQSVKGLGRMAPDSAHNHTL